jgi:DOPA 4,5-dioxygenase
MADTQRPIKVHKAYHAHIYIDEDSKVTAKKLCDASAEEHVDTRHQILLRQKYG